MATGQGNDSIYIAGVNRGADLTAKTSNGADFVETDGCNIGGNATIHAGGGDDTVEILGYINGVTNIAGSRDRRQRRMPPQNGSDNGNHT